MIEVLSTDLVPIGSLSAWLGEPIIEDADVQRAGSFISYAFEVVNAFTQRTNEYWNEEGLPNAVKSVVLMQAAYGYSNPEWWGNERVDDWGGGGRPVQEIGLALTPENKNMLRPYRKSAHLGISVLDTSRPVDAPSIPFWMDKETGGIPDWGMP